MGLMGRKENYNQLDLFILMFLYLKMFQLEFIFNIILC